ncbi:tRNA synthetase subunit beta [candidate division MSBL1 archaeon SCGC-AAA261C02]|uniref:tRNA synthetase subunit beta n=1 Tax=candidate division MSBL1 archaeon SCGC-AAA261C02 TaxID=1698272 RepID=A0A133V1Z1_9EURY|nr:tRNA synthetase subunit beta [candidate division MSBL1 archaeon SCGC-AAA261C02]
MNLKYSEELKKKFPDLQVLTTCIRGVKVEKKSRELEEFKKNVIGKVREEYNLDELKNTPIFRKYRDFFWEIGIDPTKTRPAAEALTRRILQGESLPTINTLVDAYNLASLDSGIPLAAFDAEVLEGGLVMRFAREGEEFHGIGMSEPIHLDGGEIVTSDSEKLIAIYPYRDSDETKITLKTNNVILMTCGAPGVKESTLKDAERTVINYVTRFCGGKVEE